MRFPVVQNFENRLRFDKVTESLKVGRFFETQCSYEIYITNCRSICTLRNVYISTCAPLLLFRSFCVVYRSTDSQWLLTISSNAFDYQTNTHTQSICAATSYTYTVFIKQQQRPGKSISEVRSQVELDYNSLRHLPTPPLNFTGVKKCKILARFSTPVAFDVL